MVPLAPFFMPRVYKLRFLLRLLLLFALSGPAAAACPPPPPDAEAAAVRHVHDGDTLILEDGRKLRLLGYNAPEVARRERPAEPLGAEARQRLAQWVEESGRRIRLQHDTELKDRYGRTLAHAFLGDRNVAELMLRAGLGASLIIPPNLRHAGCYGEAEEKARAQRQGIWELPSHQPADLKRLHAHRDRYTVLRARILKVERDSGDSVVWLGADKHGPRVRVFIAAADLELFPRRLLKTLSGREVEVRGWLHRRDKTWTMQLRHPASLDIL